MSKINCFRAINLNYNNNAITIEDETFRFDGESTLLSLQNGGGKSVLVQMMIAPLVRKRYRDTPDRDFASFFTTNRPTFILTEWVLDGGAGYVMVGMMVRRKQATGEEDSRDELDMVNFIYEYKEANDFDIHNIPVIEVNGKVKKLRGFNACKGIFEEIKREKGISFQYFDMNQYPQQRRYFVRLKEYQINHTEWETIIKKVNLKESGLSDLFKDAKDEAGLVEKWFLPAVESKLNKDENRIKEFAKIIYKFILLYKENQANIERKETILSFQKDAEEIRDSARDFLDAMLDTKEYEEKIAFLRSSLLWLLDDKTKEKAILIEKLELLESNLESVRFEEASYKLYCLMDELDVMVKEQKRLEDEKDQIHKSIDELTFQINTMECARLYGEYREFSGDVLLLENQLEIMKDKEKDLLPERNQLGYNLRCYYEDQLQSHKTYLKEQEDLYSAKQQELKKLNTKEEHLQKQIQELERSFGQVQTRITSYDKEESEFNMRYKASLERNILRLYEEGTLEVMDIKLEEELQKLQSSLTQQREKKEQTDESIISCSRDIEDENKKLGQLQLKSSHQEELLGGFEKELETRKMILRFIGIGEENVFKEQAIAEVFERKLKELGNVNRNLERQKEELEEEYRKLETGKVLDLPNEFSQLLDDMDLTYVYGMEWLKRNGYSVQVNQDILRQNPMLPYSIIMNDKGLQQLARRQVDFYTSFPIPIIRREDLDKFTNNNGSCVYEVNKISFFVMFNHHLLNEDSLKELLGQKQNDIDKVKKLLAQREEEIKEYDNKYNEIKFQTITESKYHDCIKEVETLEQEIKKSEEALRYMRSKKEGLQSLQGELSDKINADSRQEQYLISMIGDFKKLCKRYDEYLDDREQMQEIMADLEKSKYNLGECKRLISELSGFIQDIATNRERANTKLGDLQSKASIYQSYQEGQRLNKDIEDIEARFQALTKQISDDQKQLEDRLNQAKERFEDKQKQLLSKEAEYGLEEKDYKDITLDEFIEKEAKKERTSQENKYDEMDKEYNKVSTDIAVLQSKIDSHMKQLEEKYQKTEPIPRSQITDLAFKKRSNLISAAISKEKEQLKFIEDKINSYDNNLSNLVEFDHFTTEQTFTYQEELGETRGNSLGELSVEELRNFRGRLVRDYRYSLRIQDDRKEAQRKCLEGLFRKERYKEEFFSRPIETMINLANEPQGVLEQLTIILGSYEALLKKLEVDIALVDREKQKIIEMLLDYIEEIHKNLGKIDRNSSITVRERSIKMLRIILPEWEEQESAYKIKLEDFMEEITKRGLQRLDQNENIEEMIGAFVTTKNLYDTVVGIGSISIKLYKIESQREYPITWAQVAKNSGGEGFLSAFVVLSSLLSYMRREDTDLFFEREEGKVLLMDNPFAQTNATHLLKPLMDVAKKNNTQLICLTGLGGESIYNRFDNIYVLNLVGSGIQKDIQYVKGEHIKGEKNNITVRASQVKVEEMDQMELLF